MAILDSKQPEQDQGNHSGAKWYAVKTRSRHEHIALSNLENQGFDCYLPHLWINKRTRGKWQPQREVLFPGYLFIHVDTATQNIAPVRSTIGVIGLVRFGSLLLSVDDGIVQQIKKYEQAQSSQPDVQIPPFKPGDKLEILDGPFAGISAAFQMSKSADRVLILVNILGSEKSIAMDINSIAPSH